ncbi:hypothetical protein NDU88_004131 [Pleurodeles waltl]|uniref:Uncharacterized protein n=1 Tax=Pleurodeles waltl TaxID=8319 RepID=A0AAV7REW6_PLEWA|nr:hypothetical protein NDU88_004131 [Pleurodeles waltl]
MSGGTTAFFTDPKEAEQHGGDLPGALANCTMGARDLWARRRRKKRGGTQSRPSFCISPTSSHNLEKIITDCWKALQAAASLGPPPIGKDDKKGPHMFSTEEDSRHSDDSCADLQPLTMVTPQTADILI